MSKSFNLKRIRDALNALEKELDEKEQEIIKLKDDITGGKIQEFKPYQLTKLSYNFYDYKPYKNSWTNKIDIEAAQKHVDELYEQDKQTYEENKLIAQTNTVIRDKAIDYFKALGIPERVYTYKTPRSRTKDWITAAWVTSLYAIPTSAPNPKSTYDSFCSRLQQLRDKIKAEENQKKQELEKQQKEQEKLRLLARLEVKYGRAFMTPDEALHYILDQNKYLRLAYFLELNRGDWSSGPDYAKTGLDGFSVETTVDQEIYDEINGHIEDWCGDGRIFRDCRYNYSELYGMVDNEDLMKDFNEIRKYVNVW